VRHLLVTNDFPPKIGGIQSYLWELWRRLPPDDVVVMTTHHAESSRFDAEQGYRIVRVRQPVLLPRPALVRRINRLASDVGAEAIVLDPALPLGLVGPSLDRPYAVVLHGAEVTVPGRLPGSRALLRRVIANSALVIAAGSYPEAEGRRAAGRGRFPPAVQIPPGVDPVRFQPLGAIDRAAARARLGLPRTGPLVVSVSRLVARKGMDTLIEATVQLHRRHRDLTVAIAGSGRDHARLQLLVRRTRAPVRLVGPVPDADLPALYGCADIFAMCCRNRWWGLEQEGFGIVFLEAAACGIPSVAGDSGGAADAVVDGGTGIVVRRPDAAGVAGAIGRLLDEPGRAASMGQEARRRVEAEFGYHGLAERLRLALDGLAPTDVAR
jgi:phosphatidyl-myo-inositol dimannoside synthase